MYGKIILRNEAHPVPPSHPQPIRRPLLMLPAFLPSLHQPLPIAESSAKLPGPFSENSENMRLRKAFRHLLIWWQISTEEQGGKKTEAGYQFTASLPDCSGLKHAEEAPSEAEAYSISVISDKSCQEASVYQQKECTIRVFPRRGKRKNLSSHAPLDECPCSLLVEESSHWTVHKCTSTSKILEHACHLCAQAHDTHPPTNPRASPSTWKYWLPFSTRLPGGAGEISEVL